MAWTIYKKNGEPREVIWNSGEAKGDGTIVTTAHASTNANKWTKPELEYNGSWMGETFVTLNISCAVPIDFEIGDYIVYRGEKFVINYDPSVIKKARRGTHGEGFVYDNVKFNSLSNELTDVRMLDYVLNDNGVHYWSLPKFSFYCNDIHDMADWLQSNTDRYCDENGFAPRDYWLFVTPNRQRTIQRCGTNSNLAAIANALCTQYYGANVDQFADSEAKVNQNVAIDNMSVWDSCKYIKDTFGYNFIIRGRAVIIGAIGQSTEMLKYGKGNGLYEIERTADTEQQIVTKLYAYGSDKNLPRRYYYNSNKICKAVVALWENDTEGHNSFYVDIPFGSTYFTRSTTVNGIDAYAIQLKYNGNLYNAYARSASVLSPVIDMSGFSVIFAETPLPLQASTYVIFTGGINKDTWPTDASHASWDGEGAILPDNLAVNVLMLPNYPEKSVYEWVVTPIEQGGGGGTAVEDEHNSLEIGKATWHDHTAFFSKDAQHPYLLSPNYVELGIREGTKFFDGSDGTEEIYPTIKNSGNDTIVSADVIEDNGIFVEGEVPRFHITLPDLGEDFDLAALRTDEAKIEVTDGYCGGRDFAMISATQKNDGTWDCECDRHPDQDIDRYFPYAKEAGADAPYQLRAGDHFVLTGIEMNAAYIEWGAEKLLEAALTFLEKNDYTRYTYAPKVDEIFMARDRDQYGNSSYYYTLKEGDLMQFGDEDLEIGSWEGGVFKGALIYIDTLRIKEYGNGQIPTYEVTLRNDKQVGSIQKMQEQINSLTNGSGVGGSGGGYSGTATSSAVIATIQTEGAKYFLSKTKDDIAQGVITFTKGLISNLISSFNAGIRIAGDAIKGVVKSTPWVEGHNGDEEKVLSEKAALEHLLRKDQTETLSYLLTMAGGAKTTSLESLSFETGDEGNGFRITEIGGHYTLEIDDIIARRKFQVNVLDVKRTMFSQGRQVLTEANGTVSVVRPIDDDGEEYGVTIFGIPDTRQGHRGEYITIGVTNTVLGETAGVTQDIKNAYAYKVYTLAQDDEKTIFDFWRVGDMAMCKELNVQTRKDTARYEDRDEDGNTYGMTVANHQWDRLVLDHGTEELGDGRAYNYVTLCNAHVVGHPEIPIKVYLEFKEDEHEQIIAPPEITSLRTFANAGENELCRRRTANGLWRLIRKVDSEVHPEDDIFVWSFDGSLINTVPMAADYYVQYGNVIDPDRRGITSLSPNSKGGVISHIKNVGATIDAWPETAKQGSTTYNVPPQDEISEYIDSYSNTKKAVITSAIQSASTTQFTKGNKTIDIGDSVTIIADSFLTSTKTSDNTTEYKPLTTYMGTWQSGYTAYANQEWTYNGSKYVCNVDGTTANPPSANWTLSVSKGDKGDTGAGTAGKDAVLVVTDPSTLIIEQGLQSDGHGGYVTDVNGRYIVTVTKTATATIRLYKGNTEVSPSQFTVAPAYYQGGSSWSTSNLTPDLDGKTLTITLSSTGVSDGTTQGTVYIVASGGGLSGDVYMSIPVYINRMGTYVSQTVGDITVETRQRFGQIASWDGNTIIEAAWTGEITASASELTSNYTQYVNGQMERVSTLEQTAEALTARVSNERSHMVSVWNNSANPTPSITKDASNLQHNIVLSGVTYANYARFLTYTAYLYKGQKYRLSAMASFTFPSNVVESTTQCYVKINRYIIVNDAKSDEMTYSFDNVGKQYHADITPNYTGEYTFSVYFIPRNNASTSEDSATLKLFRLEKYEVPSVADLQITSDRISMYVEETINGNILTNTDWRGKTISQLSPDWSFDSNGTKILVTNGYDIYKSLKLTKAATTSYTTTGAYQNLYTDSNGTITYKVSTSQQYTLSFKYKSTTDCFVFLQTVKDNTKNAIINGDTFLPDEIKDGITNQSNVKLPSTGDVWTDMTITFTTPSSFSGNYTYPKIGFQAYSSTATQKIMEVVLPKLESGSTATSWTNLPDMLKKSGIDIYSNKIVATTNNFEIHNQNDDRTFYVDQYGNLQAVGSASFNGNVEASGFIAKNSRNETVFEIDSNGNGFMAGTVKASVLYTSHSRINLISSILPSYFNSGLPNKLIFYSTSNDVGNAGKALAYSVTLPSANNYHGHELEIFCQVPIYYQLVSSNYYYPVISIKTENDEGFKDAMEPISGDNTIITKIIPTSASSGTTSYLLYPARDYDHMFVVRLLSWEVSTGVYRWMILSRKDASIVREELMN